MRRRGSRASVGASLRLRRSRSAARARPPSAAAVLARRVDSIHSARLERELEADAAEEWSPGNRAPVRGTHPDAPANRSRRARSAAAGRPSTAPNIGMRHTAPSPEAPDAPSPSMSGGSETAEVGRAERSSTGWSQASTAQRRQLRQELLEAVERGVATDVEALLRFGTPVRGTHDSHLDSSLLHTAALFGYARVCELLIEHGAEVNAVDAAMETPLMWAAKWDHPEICRLLLENGALVQLKCAAGETARQKAEHAGYSAVCQALHSHEEAAQEFVKNIFAEIDTDGSGEIDQEEIAAYVLQQRTDHSWALDKMEREVQSLRDKLEEESEGHLRAQEQLAEVSAAYEEAAGSARWWEERHSGSVRELAELRDALHKAEQRAQRLAEKNAKHDSIVGEVQASAQIALKAASHAVASALERRGSHAGGASGSAAVSSVANGNHSRRPRTADCYAPDAAPLKPSLSQGRRWSVTAGGPSGSGGGAQRPASAQGEEWQAIAGFIKRGQRALPLPAGLLQTMLEQLDAVLRWIAQGGAGELEGVSRSQHASCPVSAASKPRSKQEAGDKSSDSHSADGPVLPWITERLSQAQAAGRSLRTLLEEADISLPVRAQERQSRQLERLERNHEKLNAA